MAEPEEAMNVLAVRFPVVVSSSSLRKNLSSMNEEEMVEDAESTPAID